jgi:hypothetical protein
MTGTELGHRLLGLPVFIEYSPPGVFSTPLRTPPQTGADYIDLMAGRIIAGLSIIRQVWEENVSKLTSRLPHRE